MVGHVVIEARFVRRATMWAAVAAMVLTALCVWDHRAYGASAADSTELAKLDTFFTRIAADIPRGMEVSIVQNGHEVYWKQFGGWRRDTQAPIASATKWYSAAVIMSLVDSGVFALDDRASRFLPYLEGDKAPITIRQLMSHTSGFPGEFPLAHRCLGDASDTLDHCVQALAAVPLRARPGTAFIYAGAGMQIAGRVAEVATGKDWQTLFRERVAQPLGLTATDYDYKGPTRNPRISGGGRSTVSDSMKFLSMLMQDGMYEGRRVLSAHAVEEMLRDQTGGAPIVESPFARAGLGDAKLALNRYGIGNWLEEPDGSGRSTWHSSPGALGWTPLIDTSRKLQVVIGVEALRGFQPHYVEARQLLKEVFPPLAEPPMTAQASAPAQTPSSERVTQLQERLKQIEERLALTPEQKEQVRPILQEELQQLKALRENMQDGGGNRRQRRRALKDAREIQTEADKKLRGILSESQMAELKKIREEWRAQARERMRERER